MSKQNTSMENIVRPELNLEKWPIWVPAQSRSKPKLRVLERKRVLDDGSFIINKVEINPSLKYGNLTTEDQKVWYGLLKLWEQAGKPQKLVFSLSQLAKVLGKTWSLNTFESLKKSLLRLRISTFSWENSYYDSKSGQTLEVLDLFNILTDLHLAKVKDEHKINNEQCYCQFSDYLYDNLLNNYTKPVFFDTILKIKSGVAQLIYKYLELVMHNKTYYERNSEKLFNDICLEGEEYKFASIRKRVLLIAIEDLKRIPFSGGALEVSIEETIDKIDWKLVVRKFPVKSETDKVRKIKAIAKMDEVVKEEALKEEVLNYFLERFGLRRDATKAELEKAEELIKTHNLDFEKAKHIIDFAKCSAIETNYKPKNFNGIVQYVGEALGQLQAKELKTQLKEKTKKCNFCNEEGLIGVIEPSGRRGTLYCPHDSEALKLKAIKWKIKFEFWSENPPEFSYSD
ncbi:MAG: replication initiator protein A [Blastocatellia bacterium]|nr:replication initiator protein A [Blastocatellia bacterium]